MAYQVTQKADSKSWERAVSPVVPDIPDPSPPPSEGWIYPRGIPEADDE